LRQASGKGIVVRKEKGQVVKNHKKTSEKKPNATRANKDHLTTSEIESFRKILLEKRKEILGNVNTMGDEALKKSRQESSGDLSSMPIHMADLGSDNFEQEFALGLMDSERKVIHEIDDALQRIEDGSYGICENTDQPIPKARLKAQPWARYCVEYARKLEQGGTAKETQPTAEPLDYDLGDKAEDETPEEFPDDSRQ
jgi:DnaK suppressor protein